jgi:hypothetical protein
MNSFIKNLFTVVIIVFGFFVFLGSPVAEACEVTSANFRPSGYITSNIGDGSIIIYLDVNTSNCENTNNFLKFSLYTSVLGEGGGTNFSERLIQETNYLTVNSNVTSNPFPSPASGMWSSNPDFTIPIRLGGRGNMDYCILGGGFLSPATQQEPVYANNTSVSDGDCLLYLKIYKRVSGAPDELIYSVGAVNDPKVGYLCQDGCDGNPTLLMPPLNGCFEAGTQQSNPTGVIAFGQSCPLQTGTISVITTGSGSGGIVSSEYSTEPLAPLPGFTGNPNLGQWLESLFTILIVIAGILAFIMIIVGGLTYLTSESFGGKGQGKSYIINAIVGLILALGAWVILNTINPELAEDLNIKIPTVTLDGPTKEWNNGNAAPGTNIAPTALLNGQPIIMGMIWPDDSQQRAQLSAAGISVVSSGNSNCTPTAGTPNCTSVYFDGSASGIIQEIINFKSTCGNCDIVITGGSEAWLHSTHGPNKRIVDMRATPSLNTYLNGLPGGPSPSANFPSGQTIDIGGVGRFYAEPHGSTSNTTNKHWHVTIY